MKRQGELWIFDMDGTLFDSTSIAEATFQNTYARLVEKGVDLQGKWSKEKIQSVYGYTHDKLWETLFGRSVTQSEQDLADRIILEEEVRLLQDGQGRLFAGVTDTLAALRDEGATLAIASNGQQGYIEGILEQFGLRSWFAGCYSASGYQVRSKVDLVRLLLAEIPHEIAVMVGDRSSDVEAGVENGLATIGCDYGFAGAGELTQASVVVSDIRELLALQIVK